MKGLIFDGNGTERKVKSAPDAVLGARFTHDRRVPRGLASGAEGRRLEHIKMTNWQRLALFFVAMAASGAHNYAKIYAILNRP